MLTILLLRILIFVQLVPVTMTSIENIPGTDSLKVNVRFNYELFLRDYQQSINDDFDLEVLRRLSLFPKDMANHYLNSKIFISINGKLLTGKLLKAEVNDGDIRFNILFRLDKKLKNITVRNTFLTGLYSDAENLTMINIKNLKKEIKFVSEYTEDTFDIK